MRIPEIYRLAERITAKSVRAMVLLQYALLRNKKTTPKAFGVVLAAED